MAGAAARLALGDGEALDRTEDPLALDPLDADRFARRWTVSRTICVRTSGADRAGAAVGSLVAAPPEASATVARAPSATTVDPGGDLMA